LIVKAVAGFRPTVHRVALQSAPFEQQEPALHLLELQSLRRACIDNSGIGRQLVERAQKRFGSYKVEPVTFTLAVKEQICYPLRAAFEDRTARIPDDPKIIASHRAVRKETTASGNVRFVAESTAHDHADFFWAHALALHAAKIPATGALTTESLAKIHYGRNPLMTRRPVFTPRTLQQGPRLGYFET
jgi:phage FluMu gp28-like protein